MEGRLVSSAVALVAVAALVAGCGEDDLSASGWGAGPVVDRTSGHAVPVGAVIDWWRPDSSFAVPDGYAICDGSAINDAESPYSGATLPDLTDTFVRGVSDPANIGATGGADTHGHTTNSTHDHAAVVPTTTNAGSHTHQVDPPATNTNYTSSHNHIWAEFNGSTLTWYSGNGGHIFGWSDGMDMAGAGNYPLARNFGGTFYTNTESGHYHQTDIGQFTSGSVGDHNHNVTVNLPNTAAAGTTSTDGNVPAYMGLLKIMRIK